MPDVQIEGSGTTLSFPDSMSQDQILQVLRTHPTVKALKQQQFNLDPNEQKYWNQYANAPDSKPYRTLQQLKTATPDEKEFLLAGYSKIGKNVLTKLAASFNVKQPNSTYIQRSAADLGVNPADIRRSGVVPAVRAAQEAKKPQYEMVQLPPTGGPEAPPTMLRVKGTNKIVSPGQAGSLVDEALNAALGPGTSDAMRQMPGARAEISRLALSMLEPENAATAMALGGAPRIIGGAAAGLFGASQVPGAIQAFNEGELPTAAVRGTAALLGLLGAKAGIKGAGEYFPKRSAAPVLGESVADRIINSAEAEGQARSAVPDATDLMLAQMLVPGRQITKSNLAQIRAFRRQYQLPEEKPNAPVQQERIQGPTANDVLPGVEGEGVRGGRGGKGSSDQGLVQQTARTRKGAKAQEVQNAAQENVKPSGVVPLEQPGVQATPLGTKAKISPAAPEVQTAETVARQAIPDEEFMTPKRTEEIVNLSQGVIDAQKAGITEPAKPAWMGQTQFSNLKKTIRQSLKGGTLQSGLGPTGTTGETPLITREGVARTVDKFNELFDEGAAYTRRIAPDAFRAVKRMTNFYSEAQAGVDKLEDIFNRHGFDTPEKRQLIGQIINADKQASIGVKPSVPEATIQRFASNPKVKAFFNEYNQAVKDLYQPQREAAGYGQATVFGKHSGAYMPSVAIDTEGVPINRGGGKAGLVKPTFVPRNVPGEVQFKGTGTYLSDPLLAHENRLIGLNRAAGERASFVELQKAGALQHVPDKFDYTMQFKGKTVPAEKVKLAEKFGFSEQDLKRIGFPAEAVMPSQIVADLKPAFDARVSPTTTSSKLYSNLIAAHLFGAGELGAHAVTVPSLAGSLLPPKVAGIRSPVPMINMLARMKDMVGLTDFSPQDRANAQVLAARAGVRREPPAGIKEIASNPGAFALYSKKGLFNNVVTGVYKVMKAAGASDNEIVDTLGKLPAHAGAFEPLAQTAIKKVGGGAFYSTGRAVLKQTYNPPGGIKTVAARAVGGLAFATLLAKALDKDKKWSWEQGLFPGEFVKGYDSDGKAIVGNVMAYERTGRQLTEIPKNIFQGIQAGETEEQVGLRGIAGVANQAIRPFVSGPIPSSISAAGGTAAYLVPSADKHGLSLLELPTKNLKFSDPDRLKAAGQGLIPFGGTLLGNPVEEYSGSQPQNVTDKRLNRLLRGLGQPMFKRRDVEAEKGFAKYREYQRLKNEMKAKARKARNDE